MVANYNHQSKSRLLYMWREWQLNVVVSVLMNVKHGGSGANPERYPAALIKAWQVTKRSPTIFCEDDKTNINRNLWCQWQISIANEWLFKSIWYSLRPAPYYMRYNDTAYGPLPIIHGRCDLIRLNIRRTFSFLPLDQMSVANSV